MSSSLAAHSTLWGLRKPVIPPRSRLAHLPPIAVGTLFAESLNSYTLRLAQAHVVTPRILVTKLIAPEMLKYGYPPKGCHKRIQNLFTPASRLVKGNEVDGITATAFIQALESLTLRQDISRLSLLHNASALIAGGRLRRLQAWCPLCLESWQQHQRTIFHPLIWLLQELSICPQHTFQRLIESCPYCQHSFPPLAPNLQPGFCPRCHHWLGSSDPVFQDESQPYWARFTRSSPPLEEQLAWLDQSEALLQRAEFPFYPPPVLTHHARFPNSHPRLSRREAP